MRKLDLIFNKVLITIFDYLQRKLEIEKKREWKNKKIRKLGKKE